MKVIPVRSWNKKGQMEMVGLVVIVVLLTLGMLFLAKFALNRSESTTVITRSGLASSTVTAILKTTVSSSGCEGLELGQVLLEDCAKGKIFLDNYDQQCEGIANTCAYLEEKLIPQLLEGTLGAWNKRYHLITNLRGREDLNPLIKVSSMLGDCVDRERDASVPHPLDVGLGTPVETTLFICE